MFYLYYDLSGKACNALTLDPAKTCTAIPIGVSAERVKRARETIGPMNVVASPITPLEGVGAGTTILGQLLANRTYFDRVWGERYPGSDCLLVADRPDLGTVVAMDLLTGCLSHGNWYPEVVAKPDAPKMLQLDRARIDNYHKILHGDPQTCAVPEQILRWYERDVGISFAAVVGAVGHHLGCWKTHTETCDLSFEAAVREAVINETYNPLLFHAAQQVERDAKPTRR